MALGRHEHQGDTGVVSPAATTPIAALADGGDCLAAQHPGTSATPRSASFGPVFKEAVELLPGG